MDKIGLDLSKMTDFQRKVLQITQRIPKGKVATYGLIAEVLGARRYSRAVGNALNKNPYPIKIPCHRVIRSDGYIGGFAKGTEKKEELLKNEDVEIIKGKIDLSKYLVSKKILLKDKITSRTGL
ncbi:MAG: MGMT family protein [Candidatus Helarchaeota archaeon]